MINILKLQAFFTIVPESNIVMTIMIIVIMIIIIVIIIIIMIIVIIIIIMTIDLVEMKSFWILQNDRK